MRLFISARKHWILSIILFVLIFTLSFFYISWEIFLRSPLIPPKTSVDYILPAGSSIQLLANDLHQLGILKHPNYLIILGYWKGYAKHLQAGEYLFTAGTTPKHLLQQIAQGRVLWRNMTFIEGWTFNQMLTALENNPLIVHKLIGLPQLVVMLDLGLPAYNPEGLFFPDTYRYTAGMSDKAILLAAYREMNNQLENEWQHRDPRVPYANPYQALIVASIIEKEAEVPADRPLISGVIVRRLEKNMILQMDSTVIYGQGLNFKLPITRTDLTTDTPYNTYLHTGLPPTPIAMPGLASIDAALHPDLDNNYLYFVAKDDGSHAHQFSETYSQQQAAVNKYQLHQ